MKTMIGKPGAVLAVLLGGLVFGDQPGPVVQGSASADHSDILEADVKWFDSLGYPNFADKRFVRVTTRLDADPDPGILESSLQHGFLLDEQGTRFRVFMLLDLREEVFDKQPNAALGREGSAYKDADLGAIATKYLAYLREQLDRDSFFEHRFGALFSLRTELFVLARACDSQGHRQLANELVSYALRCSGFERGEPIEIDKLRGRLAEDISNGETWRAHVDFGDPCASRQELLRRFRWLAKHFPDNGHAERVDEAVRTLAVMVEEDETHAAASRKPFEEMTVKERVAELIFQLRDQNGRQWFQPGKCDIFLDPRDGLPGLEKHGPGSPASQLVKIGRPALEQLIESVDDKRFTRSVECGRSFFFSHRIIRVGECCFAIMNRISPTGRVWDTEKDRERAKREMKVWFLGESGKD